MKKNFIGIFFAIVAIIAVVLIVLMLNYKKGISKPEVSDAARFKDEYVSLNDQTNSSNKTYPQVTISDNNKFHYANETEILDILNGQTGVIYFGFPTCPWCRNIISLLDEVSLSYSTDKIYYFNINGLPLTKKDAVIVETERGEQYGIVKTSVINIDKSLLQSEVKNVLRKANNEDEKQNNINLKDSVKAMEDCEKIKDELGLDMKILSASFTFDRKQLLFNFLADDRVDFRELAKRLASIYKTRIELRQIGVRDKAKEIGGYGQCGRKLCCHGFLDNLNGVSINMAKNQNLALNPEKINGVCGRLMCCLAYENESYFEYKKDLPRVGEVIKTKEGTGKVIYVDLFAKKYKIETEEGQIIDIEK